VGASLSSVAVRGRSAESALELLGWRKTGVEDEVSQSPAVFTVLSPEGSRWCCREWTPRTEQSTCRKGLAEAQAEEDEVDLFFELPVDGAESNTRYRYTSDERRGVAC